MTKNLNSLSTIIEFSRFESVINFTGMNTKVIRAVN